MADELRVVIDGREYPAPEKWTLGEQALFKTVAGIRMMVLEEALQAGDTQALMAFFMIVKQRAGEKVTVADAEAITDFEFIGQPEADDAVPPPSPAADSPRNEPAAVKSLPSSATIPAGSGTPPSRIASA